MNKDSYIPQHLDEQERYLFFTPDELGVVVVPLMLATVLANFLIGLMVSATLFWLLRRFKKGAGLPRLMTMAYWLFPSAVFKLKATPPSHLRELAG